MRHLWSTIWYLEGNPSKWKEFELFCAFFRINNLLSSQNQILPHFRDMCESIKDLYAIFVAIAQLTNHLTKSMWSYIAPNHLHSFAFFVIEFTGVQIHLNVTVNDIMWENYDYIHIHMTVLLMCAFVFHLLLFCRKTSTFYVIYAVENLIQSIKWKIIEW